VPLPLPLPWPSYFGWSFSGVDLNVEHKSHSQSSSTPPLQTQLELLFNEEVGLILEVKPEHEAAVRKAFTSRAASKHLAVRVQRIGTTRSPSDTAVTVALNGTTVLSADMRDLRDVWERTSFELEMLQSNPSCVQQEKVTHYSSLRLIAVTSPFSLSFVERSAPSRGTALSPVLRSQPTATSSMSLRPASLFCIGTQR
jgi:hypothetical protein